jgi:hypothetical protein
VRISATIRTHQPLRRAITISALTWSGALVGIQVRVFSCRHRSFTHETVSLAASTGCPVKAQMGRLGFPPCGLVRHESLRLTCTSRGAPHRPGRPGQWTATGRLSLICRSHRAAAPVWVAICSPGLLRQAAGTIDLEVLSSWLPEPLRSHVAKGELHWPGVAFRR